MTRFAWERYENQDPVREGPNPHGPIPDGRTKKFSLCSMCGTGYIVPVGGARREPPALQQHKITRPANLQFIVLAKACMTVLPDETRVRKKGCSSGLPHLLRFVMR